MARDDDGSSRRFGELELMQLSGLDRVTAERMILLGIKSFDDIAGWTAADVHRWRERLGLDDRIPANGWIEQATLLSRGVVTRHAARVRRGETDAVVKGPALEPSGTPRVRRDLASARRAPPPPRPAPEPSTGEQASTGSLMRRLGRVSAAKSPPVRRAAFMGPVEEATVEIVQRTKPADEPSKA